MNGKQLQTLKGHKDCVWSLAVGQDGRIYSGSGDKTIRVWSGANGTHLQTLNGHSGAVRVLAVGLDGTIYSGSVHSSGGESIRMWSGVDGTPLHSFEMRTNWVFSLAAGQDGRMYSGSSDGKIRVWWRQTNNSLIPFFALRVFFGRDKCRSTLVR